MCNLTLGTLTLYDFSAHCAHKGETGTIMLYEYDLQVNAEIDSEEFRMKKAPHELPQSRLGDKPQ